MAAARQPFVHLVLPVVVAGSILAASGCGRSPQPEAGPERSASAPPAGQPRRGADDRIADGTNAASDGVPAAPAPLEVPPLPDGTPEQLLQFVADLKTAKIKPKTQEELVGYVNAVCARGLEAADRIMARLPADAPAAIEAGRLKLDSLLTLADFQQDGKAARDAEGFARSLAEGPTPALARLGRRTLILMAAQKAFAAKDFDTIPDIVSSTADLLAADPDDTETAQLAVSLAKATESIESAGRPAPAIAAYETFARQLEKSTVAKSQQLAGIMAGTARRLALPGRPMQVEGTRLDGTAFDPATLKGKVVLVDFWATWCGPCVAEIPNIREAYEKYHDLGFEVLAISLDDSRVDLDAFLAERKVPWPILFSGRGFEDPVARFYGINGIPQLILIGRDGNVIDLEARGGRLGTLLAGLFPADATPGAAADATPDTPAATAP
jgi:thiol-disulfide isomerase/thioredoxin